MSRVVTNPPDRPLLPDGTKAGGWWHASDDDRMICDLCPRKCVLKPGDRGFCFVRENRDGEMVLSTYGRSTGFCIDPIEKKPLNHFYPGTSVLSFGTAGCNLGCKFCQNHDISKAREVERLSEFASPEMIATAAKRLGCQSVAYTYNDPIIWAEYAIDTARACRDLGIRSVAVTAGYITPEARAPFFEFFDAANVDLKAFTEDFYQHLTLSHIQPVLETLQWLKRETDVWLEITNLIIPRENDSEDEIRRMCDWILDHVGDETPVHFTAFHPDFRMLDHAHTPPATLQRAFAIAKEQGIQHVYTGNVDDEKHQSTYCSSCGKMLIQRNRYQLGRYRLHNNHCMDCDHPLPGRFAAHPGTWGPRRQPVQISQFAAPSDTAPPAPAAAASPPASTPPVVIPTSQVTPVADRKEPAATPSRPEAPQRTEAPVTVAPPSSEMELSPAEKTAIHKAACRVVAAAVSGVEDRTDLGTLPERIVAGCYVSLKRHRALRGCCGFVGRETPLKEALQTAAQRTATEDSRLPPVSPTELEYLNLEVWLLGPMQPVTARGEDRIKVVTIGKHGLYVQRGQAGGLLLPGVATENGMDAGQFLHQVCLKANLPPTAWKEDDTSLFTFEGEAIKDDFDVEVARSATCQNPLAVEQLTSLAQFCQRNVTAMVQGAQPDYYATGCPDGNVAALALTVSCGASHPPFTLAKMSLRPGVPMQANLFSVAEAVAGHLKSQGVTPQDVGQIRCDVTVLDDTSMHGSVADPDLRGVEPEQRVLMVSRRNNSAWVFDPTRSAEQLLADTVEQAGVSKDVQAAVYSLRAVSTTAPIVVAHIPQPRQGAQRRPPAVAGTFYPAEPAQLARQVADLMPTESVDQQDYAAVMVPHAGLTYSGAIAARVLSQVRPPDTIIIIGPKHTNLGVEWAVAPHEMWTLPGIDVPSDPNLALELAEAIEQLQLDSAAHQREHGIEVELPFVATTAPGVPVVGIAIGNADLQQCRDFAEGLTRVLQKRSDRTLLVISSDMNHYASDTENRRLDELALAAIETLDPEQLFTVVRENHISMCGMLPAVIVMQTLRNLDRLNRCQRVAYTTSADVSGDTSRVVGYAGLLFD